VPSAIQRLHSWWIRAPLDLAAMKMGMAHLVGEHDFKAFEGAGSPRSSTVRRVIAMDLTRGAADIVAIDIHATGFLRYMARNIVGTLVDVGLHKLPPDGIKAILRSRNRAEASATAPAKGLFLMEVFYEI
jgi:tRNA pseudouridine38-40 synthase